MQTQTAAINGARKRQYYRLPDAKREAIRADYLAGMPWTEIERKHKSAPSVVASATADLPRRRPALSIVAPVAAIPEPTKDERRRDRGGRAGLGAERCLAPRSTTAVVSCAAARSSAWP